MELKILASGETPQAESQARGKLFEKLMTEVLRHYGYKIDRIPHTNYAGMEIDIEGKHIATNVAFYTECKCYETDVTSPKLQAFFGKYMSRWFKDKRCHGLFIALPGINSHAKGFFKENIQYNSEISFSLFEKNEVIEAILNIPNVTTPDIISRYVLEEVGKPGDCLILYTDKDLFWVQYIIPPGECIAKNIAIFDKEGSPLSDGPTIQYLKRLLPELEDFNLIYLGKSIPTSIPNESPDRDEIVEVKGSSTLFEYQFPASPEHFVGRSGVLKDIDSFVDDILKKNTSSRSILFEANSGWGKSSVVLAIVNRLQRKGHFAVSIDSRSASTSQFVLRVVDHVLTKFGDFNGILPKDYLQKTITGFEGAVSSLINIGQLLERNNKIIFIFLDQFENLFFNHDLLLRIKKLFLKIQDAHTNVVLGFSWKTDLVGLTSEFPYQTRDTIMNSSKHKALDTFSKEETDALLDKLRIEIGAPVLRKDLKFLLSESSQGYPWLLKKLCAHVKSQIEQGISQADIANSFLNVKELFCEDKKGLSIEEEDALHRIAKVAPINIQKLGEEFSPEIFQSLVQRRLVVRIGSKYDIYWDIFRDYLNTGEIPVQENYILRAQMGSVLKAIKVFTSGNRTLSMSEFNRLSGLAKNSAYNVLRDMRLIGLAEVEKGNVHLLVNLPSKSEEFEEALRGHLQERLQSNRVVWRLLIALREKRRLSIIEISKLLQESCPYISASQNTWKLYASIFAKWMDSADLALYNYMDKTLAFYTPGKGIRDRRPLSPGRRKGISIPSIQYKAIEDLIIRFHEAIYKTKRLDISDIKKSSLTKTLSMLEELGFIERKAGMIRLMSKASEFVLNPDKRPSLFAESALKIKAFNIFIKILNEYNDKEVNIPEISNQLRERLNAPWKESTAEINIKIMLNWARYAKLAPEIFYHIPKGFVRKKRNISDNQSRLFNNTSKDDRR